ncbi:hypothetical protein [Enterococcus pallens]|uniref:Uncharacterized protein n=1 Tax=Enterococcus pallens ATCC BAA-351 TaxID=1158607 RepID=R2SHJ8_9ENTE|nr:hypothetical protein [Enterococcus pallens]EOH94755.1 hypothetical protein UAU_01677 [Enterococcus pallens ATCC BAA-351]EOU14926.1 hypothetical protein I588_04576 [Enterococcus pallens ATCC BAA-351]OJG78185.1 hypothetical protein RV10_GL001673 [Enterococcus pallens]
MTMQLNLTPEEEKLAKETLAKDGQTPEEAFMSLIYLRLEKEMSSKYPEMKNPNVQTILADVDDDGTLVIPEDAPEHMKDWIRHG